jgi:hypothetical protein
VTLQNALAELRIAAFDPKTAEQTLTKNLKAVREARAALAAELKTAQQDLLLFLTPAQESLMVSYGIVE